MFSPAVGRVARSANTRSSAAFALKACARSALTSTAPQEPLQQRRYSSSKPLTPPNSKKKPAGIDQNATAELQGAGKRSKALGRVEKPSTATIGRNVPFVAPTNHLREHDVKLSAFFGLHRPISISRSFPNAVSPAEFDAFFDVDRSNSVNKLQATQQVLSGFLRRVQDEIDVQQEQRADAAQAEQEVYHLDGQLTQERVENWAADLHPFQPPPAPEPYDAVANVPASEPESYSAERLSASINERVTEVPLPSDESSPRTFREHVEQRRYGMYMISVKRQRKLKMKKHKYKKLMKRTRLLRRKLDRT
ncbi:hypothetical protein CFE70_004875 [Pyrenophora teres f. teres 0-1]|uniref:Small ribosomal subunit protein mS38 n=2 Tax=Pyrenophora teres f. teres TaxID=97479 RepID=E3RE26_PYRTT|nr:hypothetical protein PTT_03594 [Pyrenophora teres f. teres 0-1]KAE8833826.1 hypothetical protein HRS9139_05645 [Pyrenophora teres f. teres]CAA9961501.1 DUF1713 domain-containing protein [Pyrenophora teres f. maculata]KAE8840402.1 hypothetical protein PTNB85_03801 [Pyrenophora teres f. teres]KAE8849457.1 hypothetical protein HRS9122_03473 [Pyrenophora teres f. teres]